MFQVFRIKMERFANLYGDNIKGWGGCRQINFIPGCYCFIKTICLYLLKQTKGRLSQKLPLVGSPIIIFKTGGYYESCSSD